MAGSAGPWASQGPSGEHLQVATGDRRVLPGPSDLLWDGILDNRCS